MLTPDLIVSAYRRGIFPMGDPDTGEVEWYRPVRRGVMPIDGGFHVPRRLARTLRAGRFVVTTDTDFEGVIDGCADRDTTWITGPVREVFVELFRRGVAHSVEAWDGKRLVGGTYGVAIGGAFMAESKFRRATDASKVCLVHLVERLRAGGFGLLDVQYWTPHLGRFGALEVTDREYDRRLRAALRVEGRWRALDHRETTIP